MTAAPDPRADFIEAGCVPLDSGHATGNLHRAEAILAAHPEVASCDVHTAAILGDDAAVARFLALDPGNATAKAGPRGWDALTHLCFSRYLRLDPARSDGFVRAARALLDAGASARTGFFEPAHQPQPSFESALYGACGVAHHAELTRLLLERGADPNDGEVVYHSPETDDNAALRVLLERQDLTADSLAAMLLRKHDWHDPQGVELLLRRGADPNHTTWWGRAALHQAVLRDNALEILELLLDHGADPTREAQLSRYGHGGSPGKSAVALAAQRGRGDLLDLFARRGVPIALDGIEALLAACARNDEAGIRAIAGQDPRLVGEVKANGGEHLAQFAGNGNTDGVRRLLDLGVDVRALFEEGDGYFGVAEDSMALHVAAWRARHDTVRLLIERGAPIDLTDGKGRTPLALAVRACVDSYWAHRRSPESVRALLQAGASAHGVEYPSGYPEVDALLLAHRR